MTADRHDRIERFAGASAGRCEESPARLHLQSGLSRRAFLKTQAACALGLAAGGVLPAAAAAAGCDIAIAKGEPAAATRAAVPPWAACRPLCTRAHELSSSPT